MITTHCTPPCGNPSTPLPEPLPPFTPAVATARKGK